MCNLTSVRGSRRECPTHQNQTNKIKRHNKKRAVQICRQSNGGRNSEARKLKLIRI